MNERLGRTVFGLAAIGYGVCALVWHTIPALAPLKALHASLYFEDLPYLVGAIQLAAGVALLSRTAARYGAIALAIVYALFAVLTIPAIAAHPLVYNGYNSFFEQLAFVAGSLIVYQPKGAALACTAFGICAISFALEQFVYLGATEALVPRWIPPNAHVWAIATTIAFAAAGIAIVARFHAVLAAQLTAAMVAGFALLVWAPALYAAPHSYDNWSEAIETVGVAAAAWLTAGALGGRRSR